MGTKKKATKKKPDAKDKRIEELEASLAAKQGEVDELVKVIDELSGGQVSAPQYPPAQQLPPVPYGYPYPYPPQPQYWPPTPNNPPYPYPYPPQPVPPQHPSLERRAPAHPGQITPVPELPAAPGAIPRPVHKKLVEWKDKQGNIHHDLVPINNPHEDAPVIPRVNADAAHAFLSSGRKGAHGPCDHCGKPVTDDIHK